MSAFVTAYAHSDVFGKLIILGLVGLSMACWIILLHKMWMTKQVKKASAAFYKALEKNQGQWLGLDLAALPKPRSHFVPHPYALIFASLKEKAVEALNKNLYFSSHGGVKKTENVYLSPEDLNWLEAHALTTISTQAKQLEKNLFVLSTIVTLAPFLGLLGTVWGILITFSGLHQGGMISSSSSVLGGISTALATTVLGLVVAIPALISFNYLKNWIRTFSSDMEDFLSILLSDLELQYRKTDI
jgi:biopolymer transport protein TolQ